MFTAEHKSRASSAESRALHAPPPHAAPVPPGMPLFLTVGATARGPDRDAAAPVPVQPGPGAVVQRCACGGTCAHCRAASRPAGSLVVNAPGDRYEREADRAAEHVMRMDAPAPSVAPGPARVSRQCASCDEVERRHLRTKPSGTPAPGGVEAPGVVHEVLQSPGRPLDAGARSFFEPRYGRDFSQVRVHTDERAHESAVAVHARAYSVGPRIVFRAGEYRPGTPDGARLLAHELAHVVQQGAAPGARLHRQTTPDELQQPPDATAEDPDAAPAPLDQPKLPAPNKAPGCDEICGEPAKCTQGPGERCSKAVTDAATAAWTQAASNVTKAVDHMDNTPDSATLRQSLKANFNWSKGNSPTDLPATVKAALTDALGKFPDNLCIKCRDCPPKAVAHLEQARGKNCTEFNCFVLCPGFADADKAVRVHTLVHELFHRVVSGAVEDLYRGQPGYPGPPSTALKMPDPYASLADDLAAAPSTP